MVTFSAKDLDGNGCGVLQQHLPAWTEGFSLEQSARGRLKHDANAAGYEVLMSLTTKSTVIWGVTPCSLTLHSSKMSMCFYQATRLHIQDIPVPSTVIVCWALSLLPNCGFVILCTILCGSGCARATCRTCNSSTRLHNIITAKTKI